MLSSMTTPATERLHVRSPDVPQSDRTETTRLPRTVLDKLVCVVELRAPERGGTRTPRDSNPPRFGRMVGDRPISEYATKYVRQCR
jgi:hypothetical protein